MLGHTTVRAASAMAEDAVLKQHTTLPRASRITRGARTITNRISPSEVERVGSEWRFLSVPSACMWNSPWGTRTSIRAQTPLSRHLWKCMAGHTCPETRHVEMEDALLSAPPAFKLRIRLIVSPAAHQMQARTHSIRLQAILSACLPFPHTAVRPLRVPLLC